MTDNTAAKVESTRQVFTRWLSDGTSWIGVFENHDLGHRDFERRISFCFDISDFDRATIGKDRSPDHRDIGLGWRYILIAKCKTVEEAERALTEGVKS